MQSIPRMGRRRRRQFIRTGRKTGDAATALRFHMIAELAAARSRNEVADKLAVAVSTVVRVAKRYLTMGVGGLLDQRSRNGARKVDVGFLKELRRVLAGSPQDYGWSRTTWTRELLAKEMRRRGHPDVAVCTMGRALHRLGARLGRAKPIVLCPWPAPKRERRLDELERLAAADCTAEPVYYSDEVDIDLNPKIGRDWMLRGEQRRVITPGKNQKHYLAGALRAKSRRLVWTEGPSKNSELFCKLLWRLAAKPAGPSESTSSSTTTASMTARPLAERCGVCGGRWSCTSCLPTAQTTIPSSASGSTYTPTSPATTAASPCASWDAR